MDLGEGERHRDHMAPQAETLRIEKVLGVGVPGPALRSGMTHGTAGSHCMLLATTSYYLDLSVWGACSGR